MKLLASLVGVFSPVSCAYYGYGETSQRNDEVCDKSSSGVRCLAWDSSRRSPIKCPDGTYAAGGCANPDDDPRGPWCYTSNASSGKYWEHCDRACENNDPCAKNLPRKCTHTKDGTRCRNWKNSVNMEKNELTRRWMQAHDNNYCGNPDKDSGGDWCYIDAPPGSPNFGFCAEKCGSTGQPPITTAVQVARPARPPSEKPVCLPRTESLFQFRDPLGAIRRPTKWNVPDQVPTNSLNTLVQPQDVLDGRNAMMGQIPWQVQLIGPAGCGGTIISSRIVITAEHCLKSPNPERWRVKAGHIHKSTFRSQNEGQIRRVAKIITTGKYNARTHDNDIAIMVTDEPFQFNDFVKPACLPPKNFKPVGGDCIISGWGKTTDGGRSSSRLLWTLIPLFDTSVCRRKLRGYSITDHMICGGGSGPDTCQGDSGGPLVCALRDNSGENQYVLAGVTSWGIGCGKTPGVYAEVADYLDWINEITAQYP